MDVVYIEFLYLLYILTRIVYVNIHMQLKMFKVLYKQKFELDNIKEYVTRRKNNNFVVACLSIDREIKSINNKCIFIAVQCFICSDII